MECSKKTSENTAFLPIPIVTPSKEGLLSLLNYNNELVLNLIHLLDAKEEGHSTVEIDKNIRDLLQQPTHNAKRSGNFLRNEDRHNNISESAFKRFKTKEMENKLEDHQHPELPTRAERAEDISHVSLQSQLTSLHKVIASQEEEISMLRKQIAKTRVPNGNSSFDNNDSGKNVVMAQYPTDIASLLEEVVHLQRTFMQLIDNLAASKCEKGGHADNQLMQFRVEVSNLFTESHDKLTRWRRNQEEMYEELQRTKKLILNSLTEVIFGKTKKPTQMQNPTVSMHSSSSPVYFQSGPMSVSSVNVIQSPTPPPAHEASRFNKSIQHFSLNLHQPKQCSSNSTFKISNIELLSVQHQSVHLQSASTNPLLLDQRTEVQSFDSRPTVISSNKPLNLMPNMNSSKPFEHLNIPNREEDLDSAITSTSSSTNHNPTNRTTLIPSPERIRDDGMSNPEAVANTSSSNPLSETLPQLSKEIRDKPHKCETCKENFGTLVQLRLHIKCSH